MNKGQQWAPVHVDQDILRAAKTTIQRAKAGNYIEGMSVIDQCVVALRDLLDSGTLPDMERMLYLTSLLESLQLITDKSIEPARALCLERSRGRPQVPYKFVRDLKIVLAVGHKYDKLIERGYTRGDSPIEEVVSQVSQELGVSTATVQKVWSDYGSTFGSTHIKSALK